MLRVESGVWSVESGDIKGLTLNLTSQQITVTELQIKNFHFAYQRGTAVKRKTKGTGYLSKKIKQNSPTLKKYH